MIFAMSFSPGGVLSLAGAVVGTSAFGSKIGAAAWRSKGVRFNTEEVSNGATGSLIVDSGDAVDVACTLTLAWHFGHRTEKGREGALASSSCKRASHFGQMRTMFVFQVIEWALGLLGQAEADRLARRLTRHNTFGLGPDEVLPRGQTLE